MGAIRIGVGPLALTRQAPFIPGATLDLRFVADAYLVGGQRATLAGVLARAGTTWSRAGVGLKRDPVSGAWVQFASNQPRRQSDGLLMEEARTNLVRSPSLVGGVPQTYTAAAAGGFPAGMALLNVPPGVSVTTAYGTEAGLPYVDLTIAGTAGSSVPIRLAFENLTTSMAAVAGEQIAVSAFARLIAGAAPPAVTALRLQEHDGAGALLVEQVGADIRPALDSTVRRLVHVFTAGTNCQFIRPAFVISGFSGRAINCTLRLYAPKVARGAYVTTPILGAAGPVTRPQDVLRFSQAALGMPGSEGALFWRGTVIDSTPTATVSSRILELGGGADAVRFIRNFATGVLAVQVTAGSVTQITTSHSVADARNQDVTMGVTWGGGVIRLRIGSDAAVSVSGRAMPAITGQQLAVGASAGGSVPVNMLMRRLVGFGRVLSEQEFNSVFARIAA
ncbi:hypothetical protein GWI72_10370 [Microvirga tunisiensis]|uniref:Uncharacterized protein n=1 Tax=Pannonibacter tanglangensis TaxID=2750084 RepID=A0A7X5F4L4_9HYPH|nr:hypothetical protein [Pannonibacter sp. XCT-53]NBN78670.1 hypothetical protein [Pannonibacter sp. XCT-53]